MLLIDDLLLLPARGFLGIFQKIHEMAERELTDEAYIQEKLLEVQLLYEMDEIGEEEYAQQEAELLARLNAIRGAEGEEEPREEEGLQAEAHARGER